MDAFALERGAAAAFQIVDAANEFIASAEPWAIARDETRAGELSQVLFDVAEAVRVAAILLLPVMPKSAAEILRRVGESKPAADIRLADAAWRNEGARTILKGDPLWPRAVTVTAGGRWCSRRPGEGRANSREFEDRQETHEWKRQSNTPPLRPPRLRPATPPAPRRRQAAPTRSRSTTS